MDLNRDEYGGYQPLTLSDEVDRQLIAAVARGDPGALRQLYNCYGWALLSYLIGQLGDREQAEEVLQDVMLAVWHSAARFRGDSRVRTWLLAIAHHHALNARHRSPSAMQSLPDDYPAASDEAHQDEQEQIRSALLHLPVQQRTVLELIFYHDLSGPEAARLLNIPISTVKSRLYRALSALRKLLKKEDTYA
jgi:RNA polymerase sigma-70 factor, ECF subfamily